MTLNGSLGGSMTSTLTYSAPNITLGATGGSFQVGGTLSVGANQASGDYAGTFNVPATSPLQLGGLAALDRAALYNGGAGRGVGGPLLRGPQRFSATTHTHR